MAWGVQLAPVQRPCGRDLEQRWRGSGLAKPVLEDASQPLPPQPRVFAGRGCGALRPPRAAPGTLWTEAAGEVSVAQVSLRARPSPGPSSGPSPGQARFTTPSRSPG